MKRKILNISGFIAGGILMLWGVFMLGFAPDPISAVFSLPFVVIVGGMAGVVFARVIGNLLGDGISKSIFLYSGNIKAPPPEFPQIRAKIARGEYADAENELRALLAEDNGNPHIVSLLAELFIDKIRDLRKAEGLLKAYLSKKGRSPDDLKFAMMLADVHIERLKPDLALAVLLYEAKQGYDNASLNSLRNRISALSK